ncbi:MAG: DUF3096 domain-containing protein [Methylohalobius sp. ZOD2]
MVIVVNGFGSGVRSEAHRRLFFYRRRDAIMNMSIKLTHVEPILALVAGILILVMPRALNFIVAIYLILIGLLGLVS